VNHYAWGMKGDECRTGSACQLRIYYLQASERANVKQNAEQYQSQRGRGKKIESERAEDRTEEESMATSTITISGFRRIETRKALP
jgi:hypothetical protein